MLLGPDSKRDKNLTTSSIRAEKASLDHRGRVADESSDRHYKSLAIERAFSAAIAKHKQISNIHTTGVMASLQKHERKRRALVLCVAGTLMGMAGLPLASSFTSTISLSPKQRQEQPVRVGPITNSAHLKRPYTTSSTELHVFGSFWRAIKSPNSKSKRSSPFRTAGSVNSNDNNNEEDSSITSFSPAYLIPIDKYRGYRRRIILQKLYNNTDAIGGIAITAEKKKKSLLDRIVSAEMKNDVRRRRQVYLSDWTDATKKMKKIVPAILFLYFSCLSPAVSFGTIASQITEGSMGIVEFLLSSGIAGMSYALLCGQPMAFIAPTGLTLAFISGLYRFCSLKGLPFFPVYSWVGIWTSFFFVLLGLKGSSQLIRFCTRFTDEIFNALLSLNFIYEGFSSLKRNFDLADPMNLTMPFVSLAMALSTYWSTLTAATFESSKYFSQKIRTFIKDFGPVTIFILMSLLNHQSWTRKFGVPTLTVPPSFQLAGGRNFLIQLNAVSLPVKLLCAFPAVLLSSLFFMDQNISVRVVNNPDNKLKKGEAYNLDMVALGLITGALSLVGLPWMCGATVQSLNHVRAMTETRFNEETGEPEIVGVTETRFTGFAVHALITATLGLLPLLGFVPTPVVAGVFLFLGRKLMSGNSFLQRVRDCFVTENRLPVDHPIRFIGRKKTNIFTIVQVACLYGLWVFKQNSATAIFFPSAIGFLMFIRSFVLPKFFTEDELVDLGDPTPH